MTTSSKVGVVYTKQHIVELMLDLAEYTADKDLAQLTLLEPACGTGAFLVPILHRLLASLSKHNRPFSDLTAAVVAYDIDPVAAAQARSTVTIALITQGVSLSEAQRLSAAWIRCGDFLLNSQDEKFDFVIGNPPYVRIEQLSPTLQQHYRQRYTTLRGRADLYVAFIERSLDLLSPTGIISFICADRWISNAYGAQLRKKISTGFQVKYYLDLHTASPFEATVTAYPAIFGISPGTTQQVTVGQLITGTPEECQQIKLSLQTTTPTNSRITRYSTWFHDEKPWILNSLAQSDYLRALETKFLPLEDHGIKVGIGAATGNDQIFLVGKNIDLETERLFPLVLRNDLLNGQIQNNHHYVINTFDAQGKLIDLSKYPKLETYLTSHAQQLKQRYIAKKNGGNWFRTSDRFHPELVRAPKLLIPDIASSNQVTYDSGHFYPHHNLYFLTSTQWDLEVLGGLLSSKIVLFFIWSYATKMRGKYLRFQAQYLRKIRLPSLTDLTPELTQSLVQGFRQRDFRYLDQLSLQAYGLTTLPDFDFTDTRS